MIKTKGIHHITSLVGNVEENVDFYGRILGLRLVKKTVNFDDPRTYHLYFGDRKGNPGTVITFFPYEDTRAGIVGDGQVGITSYMIPNGASNFWKERLEKYNINYQLTSRLGEDFISFKDHHGLKIELVERDEANENQWSISGIGPDVAIKGFAGAVLYSIKPYETAATLETLFRLKRIGEEGEFIRLKSSASIGNTIDIRTILRGKGINSVGTVHHIAWRAADEDELKKWQSLIKEQGFTVTSVRDRNYFKSIYFREKGGILFEIATDGPGFAIDEDIDSLGEQLMLPSQYENLRQQLEQSLTPIHINKQ